MNQEQLFHELIQVSIGTAEGLSRIPSEDEWDELYNLSEKHSLLGICFYGLQRLGAELCDGFSRIGMNGAQYYNWMAIAAQIQQRNLIMNNHCAELQSKLSADGFRSCLLKGQGTAQLYFGRTAYSSKENPSSDIDLRSFRQSGDIDIWVDGDRDATLDWVRSQGYKVRNIDSVHAHADLYEDTDVEVHSRPSWMYFYWSDKAFRQYWMSCKDAQFGNYDEEAGLCYPTVEFNLVYSMLHINRHIFEEGIGLRQLMDYYFILMASAEAERKRSLAVLKKMNLQRFASGIMYVEYKVFGLDTSKMICEADVKEGEYILKDIIKGGNFGRFDERNEFYGPEERWKRGWFSVKHNIRYLFHYPSEVLSIPIWKVNHYLWRKKMGYIA